MRSNFFTTRLRCRLLSPEAAARVAVVWKEGQGPMRGVNVMGNTKVVMHPFSRTYRVYSSHINSEPPQYSVTKICEKGKVSHTILSISELLKSSSMHARDLFSLALTSRQEYEQRRRKHDESESKRRSKLRRNKRSLAAILPRDNEIIVSFGNVRAVITSNSGLLFDAHKPSIQLLAHGISQTFQSRQENKQPIFPEDQNDKTISSFIHDFKDHDNGDGAFELIFLEEILREICATYTRRLILYEPVVDAVITKVSNEMLVASGVHRLVPVKDSLQEFELQVASALSCLTHLLDNDEDMLGLLLTERRQANARGEDLDYKRHEAVELLLEEYARQLSNILQETNYLLKKVQSNQELVAISLDAYRNRMLRMNLNLSIAGVGIGTATAAAGYFGMNLVSGLEESATAFGAVVVGTTAFGVLFGAGCISYISGGANQRRTMERLQEIMTIEGALDNMGALDYTMRSLVETKTDEIMDRTSFHNKMLESEEVPLQISEEEIDLLFDSLDVSNDGTLTVDDFRALEDVSKQTSFEAVRRTAQ